MTPRPTDRSALLDRVADAIPFDHALSLEDLAAMRDLTRLVRKYNEATPDDVLDAADAILAWARGEET